MSTTDDTNAARRGSGSNDLLGQAPEREDWEHLKRYGYAPGNYMSRCHHCEQVVTGVDKRATTCRPCAEAIHAEWGKPPCMQCGAMTADEALSRCMGARAEGGCHGNDLWPD